MRENGNFEKHACQNMVALETLNFLDQGMSYEIVARKFPVKPLTLVAFSLIVINIRNVLGQSFSDTNSPSAPPPPPPSSPNRIKGFAVSTLN